MFQGLVPFALAFCASGCLNTGSVTLTFSDSTATPSPGTGFQSDSATGYESMGLVTLMAGDAQHRLQLTLTGPFHAGDTATFGQLHNTMSFELIGQGINAGWSSDSGSVSFTNVSPYMIDFNGVVMRSGSGVATGEFTVSGHGNFPRSNPQ